MSDQGAGVGPLPLAGQAGAVAFLVSADAAWITGHVLVVDGGQTLGTPSA